MIRIIGGTFTMFAAGSYRDDLGIEFAIVLGLVAAVFTLYGVLACNEDPILF